MKKDMDIQVGTKPAFNPQVLVVMVGGDTVLIPISDKIAKRLIQLGVKTEG